MGDSDTCMVVPKAVGGTRPSVSMSSKQRHLVGGRKPRRPELAPRSVIAPVLDEQSGDVVAQLQAGVQEGLVVLAGGVEVLQQAEPTSAVQVGQPGFEIRP